MKFNREITGLRKITLNDVPSDKNGGRENVVSAMDYVVDALDMYDSRDVFYSLYDGRLLHYMMYIEANVHDSVDEIDKRAGGDSFSVYDYYYVKYCAGFLKYMSDWIDGLDVEPGRGVVAIPSRLAQRSAGIDQLKDNMFQLERSICDVSFQIIEKINGLMESMLGKINGIMDENEANECALLANGAKEYAIRMMEDEDNRLKNQTRKLGGESTLNLSREDWSRMRNLEEKMMGLAVKGTLSVEKDAMFEGYSQEERAELERENKMVKMLVDKFPYDKLFNFKLLTSGRKKLLPFINYNNIELFFRLVLRGNLIRRSLFQNLESDFAAWTRVEEKQPANADTKMTNGKGERAVAKYELSDEEKNNMNEIVAIMGKGRWKRPATASNIVEYVKVLYGAMPEKLDEEDAEISREFRNFFNMGSGKSSKYFSCLKVATGNLVGYLMECKYLDNSPQQLSMDFFGDARGKSNINHGKADGRSAAFKKLIVFMEKYRLRIIEKHE